MYSDKRKNRIAAVVLVLLFLVICIPLSEHVLHGSYSNLKEESAAALEESIRKSARQCYVVEGVYPEDLSYLQENYGLQINTDDYYVTYEAFADNLPPTIRVTGRE
jgi:hypothetical protein